MGKKKGKKGRGGKGKKPKRVADEAVDSGAVEGDGTASGAYSALIAFWSCLGPAAKERFLVVRRGKLVRNKAPEIAIRNCLACTDLLLATVDRLERDCREGGERERRMVTIEVRRTAGGRFIPPDPPSGAEKTAADMELAHKKRDLNLRAGLPDAHGRADEIDVAEAMTALADEEQAATWCTFSAQQPMLFRSHVVGEPPWDRISAMERAREKIKWTDATIESNAVLTRAGVKCAKVHPYCWFCHDKVVLDFVDMLTYPRPVRRFRMMFPRSQTLGALRELLAREVAVAPVANLVLKGRRMRTIAHEHDAFTLGELVDRRKVHPRMAIVISRVLGLSAEEAANVPNVLESFAAARDAAAGAAMGAADATEGGGGGGAAAGGETFPLAEAIIKAQQAGVGEGESSDAFAARAAEAKELFLANGIFAAKPSMKTDHNRNKKFVGDLLFGHSGVDPLAETRLAHGSPVMRLREQNGIQLLGETVERELLSGIESAYRAERDARVKEEELLLQLDTELQEEASAAERKKKELKKKKQQRRLQAAAAKQHVAGGAKEAGGGKKGGGGEERNLEALRRESNELERKHRETLRREERRAAREAKAAAKRESADEAARAKVAVAQQAEVAKARRRAEEARRRQQQQQQQQRKLERQRAEKERQQQLALVQQQQQQRKLERHRAEKERQQQLALVQQQQQQQQTQTQEAQLRKRQQQEAQQRQAAVAARAKSAAHLTDPLAKLQQLRKQQRAAHAKQRTRKQTLALALAQCEEDRMLAEEEEEEESGGAGSASLPLLASKERAVRAQLAEAELTLAALKSALDATKARISVMQQPGAPPPGLPIGARAALPVGAIGSGSGGGGGGGMGWSSDFGSGSAGGGATVGSGGAIGAIGSGFGSLFTSQGSGGGGWAAAAPDACARSDSDRLWAPARGGGGGSDASRSAASDAPPSSVTAEDAQRIFSFLDLDGK